MSAQASAALEPNPAILVVDDNAAKRLAVRAMLAPLGHSVIEAESGRDALRAVLRQTFAMILMDVRMPTLDGYETAKLIRQRAQSGLTPIIFVTAFGGDENETASAYASGAVDFIFTPILPDVLRAKVSAFVDLFVASQELQRSVESITALNAALRESEVRARAVLQNVADGIVTAGEEGLIESFNRSARRMFGYHEQEVIGKPLSLIIAPGHQGEFADPTPSRWSLLTAKDIPAEPTETVGCRKDGSCFPMEMDMSQMRIGERTFTVGCIRDISARKAYSDALAHRTLHDDLTGLPNSALFGDRLDQAIATADRCDEPRGVLLLDLDKFQEVNETCGGETGDALLQAVSERLCSAMRDSDTVARLGGDEFAILPSGETDVETAAVIAWKVRDALEPVFLINDHVLEVRASIGVAFFPQHGRTTADLLRRAELAMQEAKRSDSGLAVFVSEPEDQTARRLNLLGQLRDGIPRDELTLHFQPMVDLASGGQTTGVEALVRWHHPTDGLLMPSEFMPEAERSELIEPLTSWVLNEALRQQREWSDLGLDLTMAVNISAHSLTRRRDLPDIVAQLTESWGIPPGRLILELTESAIIDPEVPHVLDLLHAMGERLSIDDFGTGYSSLGYLQRLPIDQIKIDRSFVLNLASAPGDAVIVRSTVELAHNLGLTVVAEGVEDQIALERLIEYGCDMAQGYFFSRPVEAAELTAWLSESKFGAGAKVHLVRPAGGPPRGGAATRLTEGPGEPPGRRPLRDSGHPARASASPPGP
jgi:diguanylate cyclase (GGDEF)-like protein/PAS domain S-box-containing protein